MATYGSLDKLADKKVGIPAGAAIPPGYGYPTATGYSAAPTAPPIQAAYAGYPPGASYGYPQGPPPPYSVAVSQPPTAVQGYPTYASFGYPYGIPMCSQPGLTHAPATIVMPGAFDAGARFDGLARAGIPPPPPGVIPNAAQLAMMQGNNALATQQKGNIFTGGANDGGYTFW